MTYSGIISSRKKEKAMAVKMSERMRMASAMKVSRLAPLRKKIIRLIIIPRARMVAMTHSDSTNSDDMAAMMQRTPKTKMCPVMPSRNIGRRKTKKMRAQPVSFWSKTKVMGMRRTMARRK